MKTPPLTSAQQHCMATPRRGNNVHKLTENFRDPAQLEHAYYRSISAQKLAEFQADFFALPAISFEQNKTLPEDNQTPASLSPVASNDPQGRAEANKPKN